tara:strand:- start:305 stop:547 length:243 start_codon:yes stop_codon:yes gene_type:complete
MTTLDLHNVRHSKVEDKLTKFINHRLPLDVPFKIITGQSKYMHDLVVQLLQKNGLFWRFESHHNVGALVIMDVKTPGYRQ